MRINEIARELEVKAKAVIEYLQEAGVQGKKSHSSSLDDDQIKQVRKHFQQLRKKEEKTPKGKQAPSRASNIAEELAGAHAVVVLEKETEEKPTAPVPELLASKLAPKVVKPVARAVVKSAPEVPAPPPPAVSAGSRRSTPLRPPVRSKIPLKPPIASTSKQPVPLSPAAATPAPPPPAATGQPPRAHVAARPPGASPVGRPVKNLAPARPGQPIYQRPPMRPAGGPPRPTAPRRPGFSVPSSGAIAPPSEPSRRGPHPTRGRPHGPTGRYQRGRDRAKEGSLRGPAQRRASAAPIVVDRDITLTEGITVKDLSEKLGIKARDVIRRLMEQGVIATINQSMDPSLAERVAESFGARTRVVSFEEESIEQAEEVQPDGNVVPRAPVVTVMGHVDHGKTSLLDSIRETNVTGQEAGGITQHMGAYSVTTKNRRIVFLDTPGHEAFTLMRARGAKVTDVVVLVVAADDGVMPQTLEAINHAKVAKVPILVAVNKIDKPGANPERVKKQLADLGLMGEDWGGDTVMVDVSAKQKTNIETLLEMILLVADMQNLKANPDLPAAGTVLEAKLDKGRGPVCSLLVQNGTLHVGDSFLVGPIFGKVRAMLDDHGKQIEEAPPSTPVEILGLQSLPQAGDSYQGVTDAIKAKQIALYRENKQREKYLAKSSRVTLEQFQDQMKAGILKELPIILKGDVQGSVEVVAESLLKIGDERVKIKVIHSAVGAITVSDVLLASASGSVIIGFNVRPEKKAVDAAQQEKVEIRLHTIIYELLDEMRKVLTGMLEPTHRELILGKAEVLQTFRVAKIGAVAGTRVLEGKLSKGASVRLIRDNAVVHQGRIGSLHRFKDAVQEVRSGLECGIVLDNYSDVKVGDVIEGFSLERVEPTALA